jgi:hypothetical protein
VNNKSKEEEFERSVEGFIKGLDEIILRDIRKTKIKKLDLQPNIDENKKIKMEKKAE